MKKLKPISEAFFRKTIAKFTESFIQHLIDEGIVQPDTTDESTNSAFTKSYPIYDTETAIKNEDKKIIEMICNQDPLTKLIFECIERADGKINESEIVIHPEFINATTASKIKFTSVRFSHSKKIQDALNTINKLIKKTSNLNILIKKSISNEKAALSFHYIPSYKIWSTEMEVIDINKVKCKVQNPYFRKFLNLCKEYNCQVPIKVIYENKVFDSEKYDDRTASFQAILKKLGLNDKYEVTKKIRKSDSEDTGFVYFLKLQS